MKTPHLLAALLVLSIIAFPLIIDSQSNVAEGSQPNSFPSPAAPIVPSTPSFSQVSDYGTGLSGGPVVMELNTITTIEAATPGTPAAIANLERYVQEYFVPVGVNLVFVDPYWGTNSANTSSSLVLGGFQQSLGDWFRVAQFFNIKTILFFKQFGYFFSQPSWDQDFLNQYPQAATANSSGVFSPLGNCGAGCSNSPGWTIASPYVYRQLEEDLKQLYVWYGNYSDWVGFGEGGTGDKNYYIDPSSGAPTTARPFDNFTMQIFANSIFFQRSITSNGDYVGTSTVSKIWAEFLNDRPDISVTTGLPLIYPRTIGATTDGEVFGTSVMLERFFVPWGESLDGFVLKAWLAVQGSPSSLSETIYPDSSSTSSSSPVLDKPLATVTVSGVTSTPGWVAATFSNVRLVGGDYYWVGFSSTGSSSNSANYYFVATEFQDVFPDIQVWDGTSGFNGLTAYNNRIDGMSVLWLQNLAGQSITVYPYINQGANQQNYGGNVGNKFQVSSQVNANLIDFFLSDRAFDPNNQSVSIAFSSNGTILSTGTYSLLGENGVGTLSYLPIQLNKIVTLYPGVTYEVIIGSTASGDNYNGYNRGPVTQAFLTDAANPCSGGYLGQCTWAPMQLGLQTLEPDGISNYNYMSTTDLEYSPGATPGGEDALIFQATQNEVLTEFSLNIIGAGSSSAVLNVTLRADNETCANGATGSCSHPSPATSSNPVLARSSLPLSTINSELQSCGGTETGKCAWANFTSWTSVSGTGTSLRAGNYYWIVMNVTQSQRVTLQRVINPTHLVYYSQSDFKNDWGVPSDGPTDLAFLIATTGTNVTNTIISQAVYSLGYFAQSFSSPSAFQLKGLYVPVYGGWIASVAIETDSGSDSPSGTKLATGQLGINVTGESLNYVELNNVVNISASTKYWIVIIKSSSVTGGAESVEYNYYRSDAKNNPLLDYGGGSLHYEVSSNGVTWTTPALTGDMVFILAASDSTIKTYNTKTLYNEINSYESSDTNIYPDGSWATFQDYLQSQIMYNLTQFFQGYSGKAFTWYTGMPLNIEDLVPGINQSDVLFSDSGTGGPIGCGPLTTCSGDPNFWLDDASDHLNDILSAPYQPNWLPWSSFGNTGDNQGGLTPQDMTDYYLLDLPMTARSTLSFNDLSFLASAHGINDMTQMAPAQTYGSLLQRMQFNGNYFGYQKNAVKVLWIGGDLGLPEEFITGAVNLTVSSVQDSNQTRFGNLNQFNVIIGSPNSATTSWQQRIKAFVRNGGGVISTALSSSSYVSYIYGFNMTTPTSTTNSLTIAKSSAITNPYTSISYHPYWLRYKTVPVANETPTVLVQDSNGNPVIAYNNYGSGIAVDLELPQVSMTALGNALTFNGFQYGSPRDSYVSLLINAIFFAAHKSNMLPILWETSYSGQQNWSPYLQYSIDGSPGLPVLLWLSSNDSSTSNFDLHLNATFYDLNTNGWIAIDMQNMQVVAKGSGSDVHITTTVPPHAWMPIYIMNDTSSTANLQPLYSTASIISSSSSGSSETLSLNGGLNSSSLLITSANAPVTSVSSSLTGTIPSYPSISSLNATKIGYYCTSISSGACSIWSAYNQQGWYYDSTNDLLYVHFNSGDPGTLTISTSGTVTSSSSSTSNDTTSTTATLTTNISSSTAGFFTSEENESITTSNTAVNTTTSLTKGIISTSIATSTTSLIQQTSTDVTNYSTHSTSLTMSSRSSSSSTGPTSAQASSSVSSALKSTGSSTSVAKTTTTTSITSSESATTNSDNSQNVGLGASSSSRESFNVAAFGNAILIYEVALIAGGSFLFRKMLSSREGKDDVHGWRW